MGREMAYDPANDLISQTTPITSTSAAVVRMTYDPFHRLVSQTDADGNATTYVYNGPFSVCPTPASNPVPPTPSTAPVSSA